MKNKNVRLFCSKVDPVTYEESEVTEILEREFTVDGSVIDRIVEGVEFIVKFDQHGNVIHVDVEDSCRSYFEKLNHKFYCTAVKSYADSILKTGDEVEIPSHLKKKYYANGVNGAFITVD